MHFSVGSVFLGRGVTMATKKAQFKKVPTFEECEPRPYLSKPNAVKQLNLTKRHVFNNK